ncbi:MAG: single-stranded-DNA-specific exonuclease RecJ [Gammaproteobacteria bacterium]|nr:single-stranded-DNA-specific exonuclease RecJ [Gammaproteobacteria bacterium]
MSKTIVRRSCSSTEQFPVDLHPVLRRVYAARAVESADDLDYSLERLIPPAELGGLTGAVDLLEAAVSGHQRIVVVGDFDADGATSCALCMRALRAMGATEIHYLVPNRFEYGYGLTPEIVNVAAELQPDLIMTVDNGISSIEGVAAASQQGIKVLITDHHLPGKQLPAAAAIVNPNNIGDGFPSKNLAGVGVAFYVMLALRARLRDKGWFRNEAIAEPNLAQYLDLVALGTVADVVPLDRNNRILVQQGVQRMRAGRCVPGIRALLEVAGRSLSRLVSTDLGFTVGPRLNAAGRLDDMSLGIECLLADDAKAASAMAARLDALNRERKDIESDMQSRALEAIENLKLDDKQLPVGLCLFDPGWHQGVIGILAARIKERFHRPVIAFARSGDGEIKGSARSVSGLHIRDALDAVAARHPDLIAKFGGHAMAAGLSLPEAHYPAFASAFDEEVSRQLSRDDLNGVIYSDGELAEQELSLETAQLLRDASPWGQGFPAPVFEGDFNVISHRVVGQRHLKMTLSPERGHCQIDGIAFNTEVLPRGSQRVHMAYRLDVNEYRGIVTPQLIVEHMEARRQAD